MSVLYRKWLNIISFFKFNFSVSLIVSLIFFVFGDLKSFSICFITFGYLLSFMLRELHPKNKEYLFYFNNGLTKKELIIYCGVLNLILIGLINLIVFICLKMF